MNSRHGLLENGALDIFDKDIGGVAGPENLFESHLFGPHLILYPQIRHVQMTDLSEAFFLRAMPIAAVASL